MSKKRNLIDLLHSLVCKGRLEKDKKIEALNLIENRITEGYEKYLQTPSEYQDVVIKRIYKDTKYANESPNRLREILREQVNGQKKSSH